PALPSAPPPLHDALPLSLRPDTALSDPARSNPARPADTAGTDDFVQWWRDAAIYQVYVRSFADGNGDGIGDLRGVRDRLGYIAEIGRAHVRTPVTDQTRH